MSDVELRPEDWEQFYGFLKRIEPSLQEDKRPQENDEFKPGCNDSVAYSEDGRDIPTIVSRFWSFASVEALARYVDPRNWPQLGSHYWREMTAVDGPVPVENGYEATFREIVALPTGPITAYLDVTYTSTPEFAALRYSENPSRLQDVRFDRGWVFATSETQSPGNPSTLVHATKSILFADADLNSFTGLACDNGWVDLMIQMAHADEAAAAPASVAREEPAPGTRPDAISQWARAAHELVDDNVATARRALDAVRARRVDAAGR
jgi:hypothetical protein